MWCVAIDDLFMADGLIVEEGHLSIVFVDIPCVGWAGVSGDDEVAFIIGHEQYGFRGVYQGILAVGKEGKSPWFVVIVVCIPVCFLIGSPHISKGIIP